MIGKMNRRLTLQDEILSPDGGGGFSSIWQNVPNNPSVFAAVTPLSFSEEIRFRQISAQATHRITLRFREDIRHGMRLTEQGRVYHVVSLLPLDEKREYLVIIAEEKT